MNVKIGRVNGQVRRFPVKIMPLFHEAPQHGFGIGLLEQGAVGASGNALVQGVHIRMKPDDEAQLFQQVPVFRPDSDAAAC